jgi:hypothetical protein
MPPPGSKPWLRHWTDRLNWQGINWIPPSFDQDGQPSNRFGESCLHCATNAQSVTASDASIATLKVKVFPERYQLRSCYKLCIGCRLVLITCVLYDVPASVLSRLPASEGIDGHYNFVVQLRSVSLRFFLRFLNSLGNFC